MVADGLRDRLTANPIEQITHRTGHWTLVFLLITLAVTPARRWLRWNGLIAYRRMLGLFAFFYAVLHFTIYIGIDQFFAFGAIIDDVIKRPYITVGFTSFLLLIPLAVTSTKRMVKRLGGRRWSALHRLVYVAAAGGTLHFLWLIKGDSLRPAWYAGVLVVLLALRLRPRPVGAPPPLRRSAGRQEPARKPATAVSGIPRRSNPVR